MDTSSAFLAALYSLSCCCLCNVCSLDSAAFKLAVCSLFCCNICSLDSAALPCTLCSAAVYAMFARKTPLLLCLLCILCHAAIYAMFARKTLLLLCLLCILCHAYTYLSLSSEHMLKFAYFQPYWYKCITLWTDLA